MACHRVVLPFYVIPFYVIPFYVIPFYVYRSTEQEMNLRWPRGATTQRFRFMATKYDVIVTINDVAICNLTRSLERV